MKTFNDWYTEKDSKGLDEVKKWIQKAVTDIKERGTEGKCTGEKLGSPSCPAGSKQYSLAKTFKKISKKRKKD